MVATGGKVRGQRDQSSRLGTPDVTYIDSVATYTMQPHEMLIEVNTTTASVNINLPPVSLCAGRLYSFRLVDAGSNDLDLLVPNDDALGSSTIEALDLDADNDNVLLFSDGKDWVIVVNGIA